MSAPDANDRWPVRCAAVLLATALLLGACRSAAEKASESEANDAAAAAAQFYGPPPPAPQVEATPTPEDASAAEQGHAMWTPAMTQGGRDWLLLTDGEWLRGEILDMYRDELSFDSDKLNELTLDWDDIAEVRTSRPFAILLADGEKSDGAVLIRDGKVHLKNEAGEQVFPRADLVRMVPGTKQEKDHWSGKLGIGGSVRKGNTNQVDTNATLKLRRRTASSRLSLDWTANFSQVQNTTTADNQRLVLSYSTFPSRRFYITPISADMYRDPFQNIALQATPFTSVGYYVVDNKKAESDLYVGLGYRFTRFDSVGVDEDDADGVPTIVVGANWDADLTKTVELSGNYQAQIAWQDLNDTNQNAVLALGFDFWSDFDFDVSLTWNRIGQPEQDSDGNTPESDDFFLSVGLSWSF